MGGERESGGRERERKRERERERERERRKEGEKENDDLYIEINSLSSSFLKEKGKNSIFVFVQSRKMK